MQIRLIIPTQYNNGSAVDPKFLEFCEHSIADIAGGFTRTDAFGGWKDSTGKLITEPIKVYDIDLIDLTPDYPLPPVADLRHLATCIKDTLGQQSVYFRVNGVVEYI